MSEGPRGRFTPDSDPLARATRELAREMRLVREAQLRDQYRDVHPSQWPLDHPDWGSHQYEPWGGPKWQPPRARRGGPPPGAGQPLTVADIVAALANTPGITQEALAERLGTSDRRIRQVLRADGLTWPAVVGIAAEMNRK